MRKISLIILYFISLICFPLKIFFNKNIKHYLYQALRLNLRYFVINKKEIFFYSPNSVISWRLDTLFTKEPDTLKWISNFPKKNNITFWDIGANIGLYSIYASIINKKCRVYAFEPSFLNLYFLSKNIFKNSLVEKISIIQSPLDIKKNKFLKFFESSDFEGGAFNSFNQKNSKKIKNAYNILGLSAEQLIDSKIVKLPNYIKIDVDGNEFKVLKSFGKYLSHKDIKEILVEIDKDNNQEKKIVNLLTKKGYFIYKKISTRFEENSADNTFNYFFKKK